MLQQFYRRNGNLLKKQEEERQSVKCPVVKAADLGLWLKGELHSGPFYGVRHETSSPKRKFVAIRPCGHPSEPRLRSTLEKRHFGTDMPRGSTKKTSV